MKGGSIDAERITVLYDNEAEKGFKKGWGFSCLIEHRGHRILFDTGWNSRSLLYNMRKVGFKKEDIGTIVLSHDHWDHTGGLAQVLHPDASVYLPASFSKRLRNEISREAILHEVSGPMKMMDGVYLTGELGTKAKEQALVLDTGKGLLVLTGCAHPGLDVILHSAGRFGPVTGVMGGFHGFDDLDRLSGLALIVPCHCTERKREVIKRFPKNAKLCSAGSVFDLG